MYEKLSDDKMAEVLTAVEALWPTIEDAVRDQLELVTARPISDGSRVDFREARAGMEVWLRSLQDLQALSDTPVTSVEDARRLKKALNKFFGALIPGIPKRREPIRHLTERITKLAALPLTPDLPFGLDYAGKHTAVRSLVATLVIKVDEEALDQALVAALTEGPLTAVVQKLSLKALLPNALKGVGPASISMRARRTIEALQGIATDWEALIRFTYGLTVLEGEGAVDWVHVKKVALHDCVRCVLTRVDLAPLAKEEWVNVRNAVAHGSAIIKPASEAIEFRDRRRLVTWPIVQARLEAADMYLANVAMLRTHTFVMAERARPLSRLAAILDQIP